MTLSDTELLDRFPNVLINHDNKAFYRGWTEKRLLLPKCSDCGYWQGVQRPVCPNCWSFNVEPTEVRGVGRVHLLIWLYQGPPAPDVDYSTPHPVATVELEEQEGLRYTSTIIDVQQGDIAIGDSVELAWIERYGQPFPVFKKVQP
ncbi:Zn-ribbon domain-containing OB-fold protein [Jatrophihabitans sp. DSM 45814]